MSQWTHVCGCIRYDALRIHKNMPFSTIEEIKALIGNPVSFDDPLEKWNACKVPCGSEGSIQFLFWENPILNYVAAFTVAVFGDLRDFGPEDIPKIEQWFNRVTNQPNLMVRSAILLIEAEGFDPIVLRYRETCCADAAVRRDGV